MSKDSNELSEAQVDSIINQLDIGECWVDGVESGIFASDKSVVGDPPKAGDELRESARFRAELRVDRFEKERQEQRKLAFQKEAARQVEEGRGLPFGSVLPDEKLINAERSNTKRKELSDDQTKNLLLQSDLFSYWESIGNAQRFWMAAVIAYTGCRNSEVLFQTEAGIAREETTGVYYFDITGENDESGEVRLRNVKNRHSIRKIPIHSQLIE